MSDTTLALLLRDTSRLALETPVQARRDLRGTGSGEGEADAASDQFARGRSMALYEVVSLLRQAVASGAGPGALGLADVAPDRDLL